MLKMYLKRLLSSGIFWIIVVINIVILIVGGWQDIVFGGEQSALRLFIYSSNFGIGIIISLIVYAFPFLYMFCGEISGNVTKYQLIRYGNKRYFILQSLAAVLSVVILSFVTLVCFMVVAIICCGKTFSVMPYEMESFAQNWYWSHGIDTTWELYILAGVSYSLLLMPSVMFAVVSSLYIRNKYLIYAMPYVFFRLTQIISGLMGNLNLDLYNTYIGAIYVDSGYLMLHCILYPVGLTVLFAVYYVLVKNWRLRNGIVL